MKLAICDERLRKEDERGLILSGFHVIKLPPFSRLGEAVASHTDMLMHKIDNEFISYADYSEEAPLVFSELSRLLLTCGMKFTFIDDAVSPEYPKDVGLNALAIGGKLFCRCDSVSKHILHRYESIGHRIINVKQGYPACTVLRLDDDHAVTADKGMAKALEENGISVTLISDGDILLPPYSHGFIGGAAGVFDGVVYFFGDIELHRDGEKIKDAVRSAGMAFKSLSSLPLLDLGGIILTECEIRDDGKYGH